MPVPAVPVPAVPAYPPHARRASARTVAGGLAAAVTVAAAAALTVAGPAPAGAATAHDPIGSATATVTGLSAAFTGWALDQDAPGTRAVVVGLIDGVQVSATATSLANAPVTARYKANAAPGFAVTVTARNDGKSHSACLGVRNLGGGLAAVLRCTTVGRGLPAAVASHAPYGSAVYHRKGTLVAFSGRVADPDYRDRPVAVALYVDGTKRASTITRAAGGARPAGVGVNSYYRLAARVSKGLAHTACVRVTDVGPGSTTTIRCKRFDLKSGKRDPQTRTETRRLNAVVALARKQFGKPYVWAAEGPKAFDCSGLVEWTYKRNGLRTLRVAQDQFATSHLIPASRVRPGDLVFYYDAFGYVHHVGIYVSPGMTIAAMSPKLGIGWQPVSQTPSWDGSGVSYGSYTHT